MTITPSNRMAQLTYRAVGNPVNTLPLSAVSNCWPGLEYDIKTIWRRAFVGIVMLEWDNLVIEVDDPQYTKLLGRRMLLVDGRPTVTAVFGPQMPGGPLNPLTTGTNKDGVAFMEWSNTLAFAMQKQGQQVVCYFTCAPQHDEQGIPLHKDGSYDLNAMHAATLTVRTMLVAGSAAMMPELVQPGELTQGLCSPWQHDYRECACYYWAATRPDYVNVEPTAEGISTGDNWLAKGPRSGEYVPDNRTDSLFVTYDDLFIEWERMVRFEVKGRDAQES